MQHVPTEELRGERPARFVRRHLFFGSALILSFAAFLSPLGQLARLSLSDELYSHIPLMPLVAGAFLYWKRDSIFSRIQYSPVAGAMFVIPGISLGGLFAFSPELSLNDNLSAAVFSALLVWTGAFTWCYGFGTLKKAVFPLLLMIFIVPPPSSLVRPIVALLQATSVETVYWVLWVLGLPVVRDGYVFHFPNMNIKIAEECAGFHSFLALLITSTIAAKLFLKKGWTRAVAVIAIVPITIVKNSVRILVISLIVVYMGESTFAAVFHKLVGFSLLALLLLWPVINLLRKLEKERSGQERDNRP